VSGKTKPIVTELTAGDEENRRPAWDALSVRQRDHARAVRFTIALLAPAVVAGAMHLTWPFFQQSPVSLFLLAVMFSAWYGGLGPGLLSIFVSILMADYFFIEPYFAFWPPRRGDLVYLVTLVSVGSAISVLSELMHRTRRRAESSLQAAHRAELTRRAIEGRYQTLFDQAPDGIVIADSDSNYLNANASMCRMLGYTRDELIGLHASDIVEQSEVEHIEAALNVIEGRTEYHREWQFRRKNGSIFPGDVIATVMPDGYLLGMICDITERKQAEEQLLVSEVKFRTLANSIPQLAWIARSDGFIFWYNQRWHDYTGTTLEQVEGLGWQSVHDPKVLPRVMDGWRDAIAAGQPFEMEFPLRAADGRFRMFLTRVEPLKDSQGEVASWFGTNTDVDELKQMENSLRETQARLNSTLLAGSIGTWSWDIVNDHLVADEFTAQKFSIEAEVAAAGLPVAAYLEAVHEKDRGDVADAHARAIQSCGRYDMEYRVQQKDGEFRWLQARGRVKGDEAGNALRLDGAVMDITERKRADRQLRIYSARLERSNRELQDFAYVASHDLQEPLRKIQSFGGRLQTKAGEALDEECRDYLQRMFSAASRMQTMIADLMTFSRVETRGQPFVQTDLGLIAREVSADLGTSIEKTAGRVEIGELPTIDADPMQMRQLLQHLIGNSLKFHTEGIPPVVRISCQEHQNSLEGSALRPQLCQISVMDNGIGFDEKYLDRIFTVFQRLHKKGEYAGTGVGLSICRKIANRHSGNITARSSPGQGATFMVTLPVVQLKEVEVL
jgi:PAS domain S-box-containing protein